MQRRDRRSEVNRALYLVVGLVLSVVARADDEAPEIADAAGAGSDLRRFEYRGLWPFFSRETYEDGSVRASSLAGAIRCEWGTGDDIHHHVLPFYCASRRANDRQLALYPLLYLHRRSPSLDHDIVFPFFARWRAGTARHTVLWPLAQIAHEPLETPFRWIPTFFRYGDSADATRLRLGVPFVFDLLEHHATAEEDAFAFGTFFPVLAEETWSGLPLARYGRRASGAWSSHLFPLFTAARGEPGSARYRFLTLLAGSWRTAEGKRGFVAPPLLSGASWSANHHDVHVVWPLVREFSDGEDAVTRVLPFWVYTRRHRLVEEHSRDANGIGTGDEVEAEAENDAIQRYVAIAEHRYLPLLLSHWEIDTDGRAVDVLFPLFHWSRDKDGSAFSLFPFWDRSERGERSAYGVGLILYRRHEDRAAKSVNRWVLAPLVHWQRSPRAATTWVIPLYGSHESREDERREATTFLFPTIITRRTEQRAPDGPWSRTLRLVHVWPLFGFARERPLAIAEAQAVEPERTDLSTLWPFFRLEYGDARTVLHAPFPFVGYRRAGVEGSFHLFPIIYTGYEEGRRYRYLWKLAEYSRDAGGESRDFDFRILHRLVVSRRVEGQREVTVNPLFSFVRDDQTGDRSFCILKYLYRSDVEDGECVRRVLFVPVSREKL